MMCFDCPHIDCTAPRAVCCQDQAAERRRLGVLRSEARQHTLEAEAASSGGVMNRAARRRAAKAKRKDRP